MKKYMLLINMIIICLSVSPRQILSFRQKALSEKKNISMPKCTIEETPEGIFVNYTFDEVLLNNDSVSGATQIEYPEFDVIHDTTLPSLPIKWDSFNLPIGSIFNISVIDSSFVDIPLTVLPAQPLLYEGESISTTGKKIPEINPYTDFYPNSVILKSDRQSYRGIPTLDVLICPVKYDYQHHITRFYTKLSYKITIIRNNDNSSKNTKNKVSPGDSYLNNTTQNGFHTRNQTPFTKDYLIFTTTSLQEPVKRFAEWKRIMGFRTSVLIKDNWLKDSVKNVIQTFYDSPTNNLYYVLFVGDYDDIPPYFGSDSYPSDVQYGCLENQTNYISDVYLGRIPVSNNDEASVILSKIEKYERLPVLNSSFYNTAMIASYFDNMSGSLTHENYSSYSRTSEIVRNHIISNGKDVSRIYFTWPSVHPEYWSDGSEVPLELRKDNFMWDGDSTAIIQSINNGNFIVFHRDHGGETGWGYPGFYTSAMQLLNNGDKLPVVFSIDCLTGKYNHTEDCFAEKFLKLSTGGCVGIIAASNYTYYPANNAFMKGIAETIWPYPPIFVYNNYNPGLTSLRLGDIFLQALKTMDLHIYDGTYHNRKYFHCFGDPSMRMYTQLPVAFNNITIEENTDEYYIETGVDSTEISFYNKLTGEVVSYFGNNATYHGNGDNIILCVTAPNRIPFIKVLGNLYLQNETLSGYNEFNAKDIYIGSNVTSSKPSGAVTINGKTILKGNTIELTGETTIIQGAEVEITNN